MTSMQKDKDALQRLVCCALGDTMRLQLTDRRVCSNFYPGPWWAGEMQDYNALNTSVVSPSNTSSRSFDLLGGMCPWRYVSTSSKLFLASTSFSYSEFWGYTATAALSCIHSQQNEHIMEHQAI